MAFNWALQSNKTAQVAAHFAWVHSVDRLKIAQRLSAQRATFTTVKFMYCKSI
jgi:uncharacterized pyridoxal phosphate-containing UPF0001 family protein